MSNLLKEKLNADLHQAKSTGQLRAERIKDIMRSAMAQVSSEVKAGTIEIRSALRDAIAVVIESLHEQKEDVQEDVTASIEGAIEGISQSQRQIISKTEAEVKQLQTQLSVQEEALQQNIDQVITEVETIAQESTNHRIHSAIQSALQGIRNSEEGELLRRRYAQLQAQAAIVKANLAARYSDRSEELQEYLEEAQKWYAKARQKTEGMAGQVEHQHSRLETKMAEAGTAIAQGEQRARFVLNELLQLALETVHNHNHSSSHTHTASISSESSSSLPQPAQDER